MQNCTLVLVLIVASCSNEERNNDVVLDTKIPQSDTTRNTNQVDKLTIVPGGKHQEYWPSGQMKIQGQYDMKSLRTGLWMSFYEDGTKWSESYYVEGKRDGHSLTFYPNGQVRYVGEFTMDEKTGTWIFYDEEGNKTKEEPF